MRGISTVTLITLIILVMLAGCGSGEGDGGQAPAGAPAVPVVVAEVQLKSVPVVREYVARTEANETIEIRARVEAVVAAIEFEEGKPVKKGEVLYRLDPDTYQANLDSAQASLAKAQADLTLAERQVSVRAAEAALAQAKAGLKKAEQDVVRLRPLAEKDAVPRQDLDTALAAEEVAKAEVMAQTANLENSKIVEEVGILQARAAVQGAQAAVRLAQLDLNYCTIKSPIDGLIGRTLVDVGNLVGQGQSTHLATVSSTDPILVTMAISEAEFLAFQRRVQKRGGKDKDEPIHLILADNSVYAHAGKFIVAERAVALETGTLQIVAEFPNPEGTLRPGQFGRARATVNTIKDAVLVPQRAIMERQSTKVVLVVEKDNKVSQRSVQISERHEEFFVVVAGLKGGENVIVEGQLKARPGQSIVPRDRPVSSEPAEK